MDGLFELGEIDDVSGMEVSIPPFHVQACSWYIQGDLNKTHTGHM
jgi:hypothetical protein